MKSRAEDPAHLDVEAFAKAGLRLQGEMPLQQLARLAEASHAEALPASDGTAHWRAQGESRVERGGAAQIWLHLSARAALSLVCQRCLNAVAVPVVTERNFRFVIGEEAAAELDAEIDDDVLALPRTLDLLALVEDELLLALPLVPRHEVCPRPLLPPAADEPLQERPNPFAVLGVLKQSGSLN